MVLAASLGISLKSLGKITKDFDLKLNRLLKLETINFLLQCLSSSYSKLSTRVEKFLKTAVYEAKGSKKINYRHRDFPVIFFYRIETIDRMCYIQTYEKEKSF